MVPALWITGMYYLRMFTVSWMKLSSSQITIPSSNNEATRVLQLQYLYKGNKINGGKISLSDFWISHTYATLSTTLVHLIAPGVISSHKAYLLETRLRKPCFVAHYRRLTAFTVTGKCRLDRFVVKILLDVYKYQITLSWCVAFRCLEIGTYPVNNHEMYPPTWASQGLLWSNCFGLLVTLKILRNT